MEDTYKHSQYWRDQVKHGLKCDDVYADLLLDYQYQVANGIDCSEADWKQIDEYWQFVHECYQEELKENA